MLLSLRDISQPDFGGNCHLFCLSSPPGFSPLLAVLGETKAGLLALCVELFSFHLVHISVRRATAGCCGTN